MSDGLRINISPALERALAKVLNEQLDKILKAERRRMDEAAKASDALGWQSVEIVAACPKCGVTFEGTVKTVDTMKQVHICVGRGRDSIENAARRDAEVIRMSNAAAAVIQHEESVGRVVPRKPKIPKPAPSRIEKLRKMAGVAPPASPTPADLSDLRKRVGL